LIIFEFEFVKIDSEIFKPIKKTNSLTKKKMSEKEKVQEEVKTFKKKNYKKKKPKVNTENTNTTNNEKTNKKKTKVFYYNNIKEIEKEEIKIEEEEVKGAFSSSKYDKRQQKEEKNTSSISEDFSDSYTGLTSELIIKLTKEKLECMICSSFIKKKHNIWSCDTCYLIVHLGCIREWYKQNNYQP
jgi:hypothetical protein